MSSAVTLIVFVPFAKPEQPPVSSIVNEPFLLLLAVEVKFLNTLQF